MAPGNPYTLQNMFGAGFVNQARDSGADLVKHIKGGVNAWGQILSPVGQDTFNMVTGAAKAATRGPYDDWLNAPTAQQSSAPRNFGPNYKQKELAAGQAAENFRRGAGFPGQISTAGAGPNGPNPNAIVQGQDGIGEEYRQRMNAYNNQAILARQSLQGYDPSKGPLPGAAQEAQDQGMDIWKGVYAGTKMAQPGGAVGTFNPLMQGRGDVPSMEELWKGVGGGAPTSGPGDEAIKAAMAQGQYHAAAGSPNPFGQPANTLPAPPQQQGNAVSAPYAPAQAEAAKNTAGATGMPQLPTTPEAQTPGTNFLDKAMSSPWGDAIKNTLGGMLLNKIHGF